MSELDKLIDKMKRQPSNISFEEVSYVLTHKGFILRRTKGSHCLFKSEDTQITIPKHNPVKTIYIKVILALIKE